MPSPKNRPLSECNFHPNFEGECRICGTSPTVVCPEHPVPETNLCGAHFFSDKTMVDWAEWNEQPDDTE